MFLKYLSMAPTVALLLQRTWRLLLLSPLLLHHQHRRLLIRYATPSDLDLSVSMRIAMLRPFILDWLRLDGLLTITLSLLWLMIAPGGSIAGVPGLCDE